MDTVTTISSLSEVKEFLEKLGTDFFDTIEYDNDAPETKLNCIKASETILQVTYTGTNWSFEPYIAHDTPATGNHAINNARSLTTAYRFGGGACFRFYNSAYGKPYFLLAIGKTANGKTAFLTYNVGASFSLPGDYTFYPTSFGDSTSNLFYANGYHVYSNSASADRTILSQIPVPGEEGSNDYFSTLFVRNAVQFLENGQQKIGGELYGCVYHFAFTDKEES